MFEGCIDQTEIIVHIQHIEHLNRPLIGNGIPAESDKLVENRQRVTHTSIGFLCNHIQRFFIRRDTFFRSHRLQICDCIGHRYTIEIVYLATAKDCRQHFMFLCRGKNKNGI